MNLFTEKKIHFQKEKHVCNTEKLLIRLCKKLE